MLKEFCGYDIKKYDLYQKERKERIRRNIITVLIWVASSSLVVFIAYFLVHNGVQKTSVVNSSMSPTLERGDDIVINCFSYKVGSPSRFDVCVVLTGDKEHSIYDVKRIYGLPGETIQITGNDIYINGKKIKDVVKVDEMELAGLASSPIQLGKDEYFVLADDRNNAEDSRYSNYGLVKENEIIGKAWLRTNEFGFVNMLNKK